MATDISTNIIDFVVNKDKSFLTLILTASIIFRIAFKRKKASQK